MKSKSNWNFVGHSDDYVILSTTLNWKKLTILFTSAKGACTRVQET